MKSTLVLLCLSIFVGQCLGARQVDPTRGFAVDDYFSIQRIDQLALSSDGKWLAYTVSSPSLSSSPGSVKLTNLDHSVRAKEINSLNGARALAWIPGTYHLAFLSPIQGVAQISFYDAETGEVRQISDSGDPIISFRFAPNGTGLAYVTQALDKTPLLYERLHTGKTGVLIDSEMTSVYDFINPDWRYSLKPTPPSLWVAKDRGPAREVPVIGSPQGAYFWSPDSRLLSLTYEAKNPPPLMLGNQFTGVGIVDVDSTQFRVLSAAQGTGPHSAIAFAGGEWFPDGRHVLIRRVSISDPWVSHSFAQPLTVDAADGTESEGRWHEIELTESQSHRIWPVSDRQLLVENIVCGVHSLFDVTSARTEPSPIVAGLNGSNSKFQLSADHDTVAFVAESLTRPPEIYVRRRGVPARQFTHLNDGIAARVAYRAREVLWNGSDGVRVAGWLLEPPPSVNKPWPMITMVHGGPGFAYIDGFAPYWTIWPYPFEVFAERGFAVFIPNYRGTKSYGRQIASATDAEAENDVITGVKSLVEQGIADPKRLGIAGHSHGGWLGPLIMAKAKFFSAASFAEGWSNDILNYETMSEDLNRKVHDLSYVYGGVSLYDAPESYLAQSPDLQFRGLSTPALFEAGVTSGSISMMGFPKAAHRAGMPTEYFVYPDTDHNPTVPSIQREIAQRNLDWFEFWLNGREDNAWESGDQYARWENLRATPSLHSEESRQSSLRE